jgi:Acyl-CoA dehydrogenase, C-terminal domain
MNTAPGTATGGAIDADMLDMLRSSLRRVLTEVSDVPLDVRLGELGWDDVIADDAPNALQALFEISGEMLSPADPLSPLMARRIGESLGRADLSRAALVLPRSLHPDRLSSHLDGDRLVISGVVLGAVPSAGPTARRTADQTVAQPMIVPALRDGMELVLAVVDDARAVIESGVRCGAVAPESGQHPVATSTTITVRATDHTVLAGPGAATAWSDAVALGRWVSAAELVGIGTRVLATAIAYAGERHQYGRAIGSFQALQHRIASAHVLLVGARHIVDEAARHADPWVALVAKAAAGRAAELACTQAQQTYGAIGFTWEHEFHRYLRRSYLVDRRLGDWRTLEFEIGRQMQATGRAPRIGAL